ERGLLDLAGVADPLGLDTVGHQRVRDAGRRLDAGVARQQRLDEGPGRGPGIRVERAAAGAAPGRVGVRRGEGADVERGRVADLDRAVEVERGEVGPRDLDAERVEVDPGRGQPCPAELDQVTADPAGEVAEARAAEGYPGRAVPGHGAARGLLEPVAGEVHPARVVAELGDRMP